MKFGFNEIVELGNNLSEQFNKYQLSNNTLIIEVDKESLTKIDEDIFYRQNGNQDEYIPPDKEIMLTFNNFIMKIIAKEDY